MIDTLCHLLAFNPERGAWVIAFDDAARGLTPDAPCYLMQHSIISFTPVNDDGEIMPEGLYAWGPGIIRLAPQIWDALPRLVCNKVTQRERAEAAERAFARKKLEAKPRLVRRNEDRMLRARNAKTAQGKLF